MDENSCKKNIKILQPKSVNARQTNKRTNRGQNIQIDGEANTFNNQSSLSRQTSI